MNWNELNELELETQLAILETEKATSETQRHREPYHRLRAILKTQSVTQSTSGLGVLIGLKRQN